jgi:predicted transcriptional regulator
MKKTRSRISTETADSILRSLGTGSTKPKIMFSSDLPYFHLDSHLSILVSRRFVDHEPETGLYKITPSGIELLRTIEELRELVGEPRKEEVVF